VLKKLGEGEQGIVFKAWDAGLQQPVALKVLRPDRADAKAQARFLREAQAAAALEHDHVVRVYGVAAPSDGPPYLVMQYVEGPTLLERIRHERRLEPREAAAIACQVAQGLAVAHRAGLVHRDIKPSNILWEAATRRAKITDFDLMRLINVSGGTSEDGVIAGTPEYMSPEQVRGEPVDARSDVYSLGVTLYEALTGTVPFPGPGYMVLRQVLDDEPRPPRRLNDRIPRDLETICLKCLQKEPRHRYASADALADELRRFLTKKPICTRPVRPWERALRWARRHPAMAALLAALVGVSAAGTAALLIQGVRYNAQLQVASQEVAARQALVERATTEAERERHEARLANLEAQQRLGQTNSVLAFRHLDRGDSRGALTLFAEAMKVDQTDRERSEAYRIRFGTVLRQLPRLIQVLEPERPVNHVAFSPDGDRVLIACDDGTAGVWDTATGRLLTPPLLHKAAVRWAAFSPDGCSLLTASSDAKARLWEAATGDLLTPPLEHPAAVSYTAFSLDGCRLLTVSGDRAARVWDVATRKALSKPLQHQGPVWHAAFSPDGNSVVTASLDHTAQVWDAATGKPLFAPFEHPGPVFHAAFSPDGRRLATACMDGTARLWDTATGQRLDPSLAHSAAVNSVCFSPDGRRLLTASRDEAVRLWDAATGRPLGLPLRHDSAVRHATFSPDGRHLLTTSEDETTRLWDAAAGRPLTPPLPHAPWHAALSPNGRHLLTVAARTTVLLWEVAPSQPTPLSPQHDGRVEQIRFSQDTRLLLTTSEDQAVRLWDAATGRPLAPPLRHPVKIHHVAVSGDRRRLLTIGTDQAVRVWDIATGQPFRPPLPHEALVFHASFSPDGHCIRTASQDATIRLWNATTGRLLTPSLRHEPGVRHVFFSPDGRLVFTANHEAGTVRLWDLTYRRPRILPFESRQWLVDVDFNHDPPRLLTTSPDHVTQVWDLATDQPLTPPLKHEKDVRHASFSPDGRRVLTASHDGTAQVWDAGTGRPLAPPLKHDYWLASATFSPDGRRILTVGTDDRVRLWDAATSQPLTPCLQFHVPIGRPVFSPPDGHRILVSSVDGRAWVWDVSADDRPADDMVLLAQLVTGHQIDAVGHFTPVNPAKRRQAWQALRAKYPCAFDPARAEEFLSWHRSQAAESEFQGDWFAARWHLDRLIVAEPERALYHARRGNTWAEVGQWEKAAADYNRAVELQPDAPKLWQGVAYLRLQLGDREGYRQVCARLLERFGRTTDPRTASQVARLCVLVPNVGADLSRPVQLAETAVASAPRHSEYLYTLGLVLYRCGRFDQAVACLTESQADRGDAVAAWLLLASTHHLRHAEEARFWLDKAARRLEQAGRERPPDGTPRFSWDERLEIHLLRREAEALLNDNRPPEREGPKP
jgi:WD40 repeat protein/tetratricopeptide (TPR) repeat protein